MLVFILSSFEKLPTPKIEFELFDKLIHFIEFFVFSILALRAIEKWKLLDNWKWNLTVPLSILLSTAYAASDEIHQYFVPGRSCDLYDFWADMVGIIVGAVIYCFIKQLLDKRLHQK